MIVVGITGTLGAGKSTVGELFERWGAFRIDADRLAREAVRPGSPALRRIREEWGEAVLDEEGGLDREAMRRVAFEEPGARERLEEIVHPEVGRLREERLRAAAEEGAEVVAAEVPLLLETGMEEEFDLIVVVDAPAAVRRERLIEARGLDAETFGAIEDAQWSAARKRRAADHVIRNEGSRRELEERAREVWEAIIEAPEGNSAAGPEGDAAAGPERSGSRSGASDGPDADRERAPREEGGETWAVDLHLHTSASFDCTTPPGEVVERARELGLDRIAVTDHNEIDGAFEAREIDPELVIVGEEVLTREGLDVIGLWLDRHIERGLPFRRVAEEIREQGGIVYLPHPLDPRRGGQEPLLDTVADCVDVVEGFNARTHDPEDNRRGRAWAEKHGLPVAAGSDAHTVGEIGRARVVLPPFDGPGGLLEALAGARIEGRASGRWVHLSSTLAKLRKRFP